MHMIKSKQSQHCPCHGFGVGSAQLHLLSLLVRDYLRRLAQNFTPCCFLAEPEDNEMAGDAKLKS
jgi:hypothetical protein